MSREKIQQLFKFPMKGIHRVGMKNEQPEGTAFDCLNVRPFDVIEDRARGGSRPGLGKYSSARGSNNRVQDLNKVTTVSTSLSVSSMSRRTVTPVQVTNGVIAHFNTTAVTNATVSGTQALGNSTQAPFCFSAELFQKLYFADGFGYKVYTQANTTAHDWTPTAGSLPGDIANNVTCRLIEAWRGRIVMAGLATDPSNWFMSKLGEPLDWDTGPANPTELDAVTGGAGFVGKVPDVINAIIPYTDDVLLFGCDHSIWMMSGDPQAGGRLDLVTNTVGMAFGRPYTQLPDGTLLFFSNRGSVYNMAPGGGKPKNITEGNIDPLITNTNLNTHVVRMAYDEKAEGVHLWITPLVAGAATHWYLDIRNQGWFKVEYPDNNFNPIAVTIFEGDDPDDREILMGGQDGYVRLYNTSNVTDDGTNFNTYAILGPIVAEKGRYPTVLTDVQFIMDDTSANTIYEIGVGDTAESAIADFAATFTGEVDTASNTINISTSKSKNINPRTRGYFQYFKIGTQNTSASWAIEYIQASWSVVKSSRGRMFQTETIGFADPDNPPLLSTTNLHTRYASSVNLSTSGSNVTTWTAYQVGSGITAPTWRGNTSNAALYVSADTELNNQPSVTCGLAGRVLYAEEVTGMNRDNAFMAVVLKSRSITAATGVMFGFAREGGSSIRYELRADGTPSTLDFRPDNFAFDGVSFSTFDTGDADYAANTGLIIVTGHNGSRWITRVNGVEIMNAVNSTGWTEVDAGNNLVMDFGSQPVNLPGSPGSQIPNGVNIADFCFYTQYNLATIQSVELAYSNRYNITLP